MQPNRPGDCDEPSPVPPCSPLLHQMLPRSSVSSCSSFPAVRGATSPCRATEQSRSLARGHRVAAGLDADLRAPAEPRPPLCSAGAAPAGGGAWLCQAAQAMVPAPRRAACWTDDRLRGMDESRGGPAKAEKWRAGRENLPHRDAHRASVPAPAGSAAAKCGGGQVSSATRCGPASRLSPGPRPADTVGTGGAVLGPGSRCVHARDREEDAQPAKRACRPALDSAVAGRSTAASAVASAASALASAVEASPAPTADGWFRAGCVRRSGRASAVAARCGVEPARGRAG
jgi:hypothetical protein